MDAVGLERRRVVDPPVLHDLLLFRVCDDNCKGYLSPTQDIEKQAIVALQCGSDPPRTDAKDEEIDAASAVQGFNQFVSLFDGAKERVDTHLWFPEPDGVKDIEYHWSRERKRMLSRL